MRKALVIFISLLMVAVVFSGCVDADLKVTKFGIIGAVTSINTSNNSITIMVEGEVSEYSENDKASVRIDKKTKVLIENKEVSKDDLTIGMYVKIIFSGPVMESYPVQAYAKTIIVTSSMIMEKNTYDITPVEVANKIGCEIFKNNETCESYLEYQNETFPIGMGFGGMGLVDINTCDFDNNGQYDLIYTFSYGSGLHRSQICCFNMDTKKEIVLECTYLNNDMLLEKVSNRKFNIFHADITFDYENFANLKLEKGAKLGEIVYESSEIKVIPEKNVSEDFILSNAIK